MNQFRFFLAASVLAMSSVAQAFITLPREPGDSPVTKIQDPGLVCEAQGVMYAINYQTEGQERVWQGDPGDTEGLELHVAKFVRLSSPVSYNITAYLQVGGERIRIEMPIRGKVVVSRTDPSKIFLKITAWTKINGQLGPILECHF